MSNFVLQQTDAEVQEILNKVQPFASTNNVSVFGFGYGVCTTAGATAAKSVSIDNTVLTPGGVISVNFTNAFTVSNPTLSVNGSAPKPIKLYGSAMPMWKVRDNTILTMNYDGTQFNVTSINSKSSLAPTGFVDLALPSGLLWAEKNVGAATPYDYGLYFSWGNVTGHTAGDGYDFGNSNDGPYASTPGAELTGSIPANTTYDAAMHNMGTPCRMPTVNEFQELVNNCTSEWTDENGVNGRRFISRNNGNSVFFPAAGQRIETITQNRMNIGYYWSSSNMSIDKSYSLYFHSSTLTYGFSNEHFLGTSIRSVQ